MSEDTQCKSIHDRASFCFSAFFFLTRATRNSQRAAILRSNPGNEKAKALHLSTVSIMDEEEHRQNMMIGGGVIAVGALALGMLFGGKKR